MLYTCIISGKIDKKCFTGATAVLRKRFDDNKQKRFLSLTGFTLIEILFVVIILSILIVFSIPQLKNAYKNLELNSFAREMQSYMNYLSEQSIVTEDTFVFSIDNDNKQYWALVLNAKNRLKTVAIPEGIKIITDQKQISFYPDGSIDIVTIKLSNDSVKFITLTTKGVFGSVKIQTQ